MAVLGRNTLRVLGAWVLPGINAIGAVWLGMSLRAARATWGHPAGIALTGLRALKLGTATLRLLRPLTRYEFCGRSRRRRALRGRAAGGRTSRCTTLRSAGGAASLAKSRRRAGIRLIDGACGGVFDATRITLIGCPGLHRFARATALARLGLGWSRFGTWRWCRTHSFAARAAFQMRHRWQIVENMFGCDRGVTRRIGRGRLLCRCRRICFGSVLCTA
jgi:hypothetical protein